MSLIVRTNMSKKIESLPCGMLMIFDTQKEETNMTVSFMMLVSRLQENLPTTCVSLRTIAKQHGSAMKPSVKHLFFEHDLGD